MDNSVKIIGESRCCGCAACEYVCKYNAIKMQFNGEGFYISKIDKSTCVNCGSCLNICPQNIIKCLTGSFEKKEYVGSCNSIDDVLTSSSGGIAYAIGKFIIDHHGVVFGVGWDNFCQHAKYKKGNTYKDIKEFRGSKYIQAIKNDLFEDIANELRKDKMVLFIGLPCEAAAVKALFGSKNNLIICDLICWGPTSQLVYEGYRTKIEKRFHKRIIQVNMRQKFNRAERPYMSLKFNDKSIISKPFYETEFGMIFSFFGRQSCYNCNYQNDNSIADLSLGDFVGINSRKYINRPKGLSRIVIRTKKGESLLKEIKNIELVQTYGETERYYQNRCLRANNRKREVFSFWLQENNYSEAEIKTLGRVRKLYRKLCSRWEYLNEKNRINGTCGK